MIIVSEDEDEEDDDNTAELPSSSLLPPPPPPLPPPLGEGVGGEESLVRRRGCRMRPVLAPSTFSFLVRDKADEADETDGVVAAIEREVSLLLALPFE